MDARFQTSLLCPEDLPAVSSRNIGNAHECYSDLVPKTSRQARRCWTAHSHRPTRVLVLKPRVTLSVVIQFSSPPRPLLSIISNMNSKRSRRPTIVDRLRKLFKSPKSSATPPSSPFSSVADQAQIAPASRMYSLGNRSEGNTAHKWSFAKRNASSASIGRQPRQAKGAEWYIPNETTIFPLPAPRHPALRSHPASPITPARAHVRRPSLSMSASSHGTSDLHTPSSTVESQPQLWIPKSGTIVPSYEQKLPTPCRDGIFFDHFDPYDAEAAGDGPESARDPSGIATGIATGEEDAFKTPENAPTLDLRSSIWIRNEVAGIQDDEMRRLASLAFL